MTQQISKDVLTTGEVAKICHVAPRTVSKWFDTGKLRGYRIPGSRDRRIPVQQLVAFMKQHGMPLDGLDLGTTRLLIVSAEANDQLAEQLEAKGSYEVRTADSIFDAGIAAQQFGPQIIVLDWDNADEAAQLARHIKDNAELATAWVVLAVDEADPIGVESADCDATVSRPVTAEALLEALETAAVA
ncbi:MAG: helix-turn-helix domain-containing protein [Phycisphaerae bacterium]